MKAGPNPKTWYPHSVSMMPSPDDPPEVDPRRKDPDRPSEAPPVRMPVVDVGGNQMDVISRLLKDRILLLGQQVNDEVANVLVAQLLYLANDDPDKDITLYINSPGGSVSAGMAIYDAMQYVPCDVSTVCFGTAASMGAFLLGAGAKGKRRSLPNARIMIHQPLGGAQGQAADIEIQAKEILFIRSLLNSYMAEYCDQPADKIKDDCDRDFFMTPEEAMDYGLIDEVITTKTSHISKPAMPSLEEPPVPAASALLVTLGFASTGLVATTERIGAFVVSLPSRSWACPSLSSRGGLSSGGGGDGRGGSISSSSGGKIGQRSGDDRFARVSSSARAPTTTMMGLWGGRRTRGDGRRDGGEGGEMESAFLRSPGVVGGAGGPGDVQGVDDGISGGRGVGFPAKGAETTLGREAEGGNFGAAGAGENRTRLPHPRSDERKDYGDRRPRRTRTMTTTTITTARASKASNEGEGEQSAESTAAAVGDASGEARKNVGSSSRSSSGGGGGGSGSGGGGGDKGGPYSAAAAAEAARRRIKRARVALEEALDELGRSAIDELGLAPPAYMGLDFTAPPPPPVAVAEEGGEGAAAAVEEAKKESKREEGERMGWLRQWKNRGGMGVIPPNPAEEVLERLEEGLDAVGEVVEESFEAVGESVLELDDRVGRARASVETALNELGLTVPSESSTAAPDRPKRQADGATLAEKGLGDTGGPKEAAFSEGSEKEGGGEEVPRGGRKASRWWIPERLRSSSEGGGGDASMSLPTSISSSGDQQQQQQQQQKDRTAFFRRSLPLPLPSLQAQRAAAERAVKRAKTAQRAVAQRTVKRAKVALGTAMDDLGLTRPPVGSALERFLNADELLGLWREEEAFEDQMQDGDDVMPGTDIGNPERRIWVVTTAALPWMTGTSVNPLLRAAYLTRGREPGKVSLMIPWLGPEDQHFVLPEGRRYESKRDQESYIRDWLRGAGMTSEADDLGIAWYDARYHQVAGCIFPMGDITRLIPDDEADVCIMEEPEHLNWFRASGVNWSKKFTHVVGVIHTNYVHYTMADTNHWASGRVKAPFARAFNKIMARAYCDKVIKLSATLQKFAEEKETVTNVHGVRENFLIVGDRRKEAAARGEPFAEGDRPYFLGKMLWEKGYGRLWDLLQGYQNAQQQQQQGPSPSSSSTGTTDNRPASVQQPHATSTSASDATSGDAGGETSSGSASGYTAAAPVAAADGGGIVLSAYGSGPNSDAIRERAESMGLDVEFNPATDHAELSMYKTFVNPSESEVLCTTVAEALAMGKFVVIAEHASNEFFYQFPNTLKFKTQEEFNEQLKYSIANEPLPLTPEQRHILGWSAATDRLINSAKVTVRESLRRRRELDEAAWLFHYYLGSGRRGDRVRKIMAGGVVAGQHAHMELVLKAENEAREAQEFAAASAGAGELGISQADTKARTDA
eukprot:g1966.t1